MKKVTAVFLSVLLLTASLFGGAITALAADETEDFSEILGSWEKEVYTNELLGVRFTQPEKWTHFERDELLSLAGLTAAQVNDADIAEMLTSAADSGQLLYILYAASPDGDRSCNVTATRLNAVQALAVTEESYVDASAAQVKTALASMGLTDITAEKRTVLFAGKEHPSLWISGKINNVRLYEQVAVLKHGDLIACVTVSTAGTDDTDALLSAWTALNEAEPEAILGRWKNGVYTNEVLDTVYTQPEGWTHADDGQLLEMAGLTGRFVGDAALAEALADAAENGTLLYILLASDAATGSSCVVTAEKITALSAALSEKAYLELAAPQTEAGLVSMGVTNIKTEMTTVVFAGAERTALRLSCQYNGMGVYELLVVQKQGGYFANYAFTSVGSDATDRLLADWAALTPAENAA